MEIQDHNPQEYVHTIALLLDIATLRSTIMYVQLNNNILVDSVYSLSVMMARSSRNKYIEYAILSLEKEKKKK